MSIKQILWPPLAAALLSIPFGCASAYHAYPCGCVPYGFCPAPPLPFSNYCGCLTPRATQFQCGHATAASKEGESLPCTPATD